MVHRAEGSERPTFAAPVAATPAGDVARRITRHKRSAKTPRRVSVVTSVNEPLAAKRGLFMVSIQLIDGKREPTSGLEPWTSSLYE